MSESDPGAPTPEPAKSVAPRRTGLETARRLSAVGLILATTLGLVAAWYGGAIYLLAPFTVFDNPSTPASTIALGFLALYGPPLGLLVALVCASAALWARSNRMLVAAAVLALAAAITVVLVPASALPFVVGAESLNVSLPAPQQAVNFPLRVSEERRIPTGGDGPTGLAWSPDGSRLAAIDNRGFATVWDRNGRRLSRFDPSLGVLSDFSIAFVGGSSQLLLPIDSNDENNDDALGVHDALSGHLVNTISGPGRSQFFDVSPDRRLAAFGLLAINQPDQPAIAIVDTSDWKIVRTYSMREGDTALGFFAGGRQLVAGSFHGLLDVWDPSTNQPPRELTAFPGGKDATMITVVAGSPDGGMIFAGGGANPGVPVPAAVVRASDGAPVATFPYATGQEISGASWDPKGRYLAIVDGSGNLFLWRPGSRKPSYLKIALPGPPAGRMPRFAISPDGTRIAASAGDGILIFSVR